MDLGMSLDDFSYVAIDKHGSISNVATVTINIKALRATNTNPQAYNLDYTLKHETTAIFQLNATDVESPKFLLFVIDENPKFGNVLLMDEWNGIVKYSPFSYFNGQDNFTYYARVSTSTLRNDALESTK